MDLVQVSRSKLVSDTANRKFPPSVMVFGVIGVDHKSKLLFIEETVDARRYMDNLEARVYARIQ
jgi:hypothetical protein